MKHKGDDDHGSLVLFEIFGAPVEGGHAKCYEKRLSLFLQLRIRVYVDDMKIYFSERDSFDLPKRTRKVSELPKSEMDQADLELRNKLKLVNQPKHPKNLELRALSKQLQTAQSNRT